MSDPTWLEAIKDAYLADRASVFLLHGPGTADTWTLDGEERSFIDVLRTFLARSREVVGQMDPPQALRFPGIGDVGRFERILSAAFLVAGAHLTLADDEPEQALAKIWIALSDANTPQGYVIGSVDTLYPAHRKRVLELAADAPELWDWCTHDRLRKANHIVLLVARELSHVRPELIGAAETIEVRKAAARAPEPAVAPEAVAPEGVAPEPVRPQIDTPAGEVDTATGSVGEVPPSPSPVRGGGEVDLDALVNDLNTAIRAAIASQDEELRAAKAPVMAGVATILGERTGSPGALTWAVDEDGKAVASGDGADDFLARWRSDIALDASAGMVIGKLGKDLPDRLDETGLRAMAKRLIKKHL